jgi:hypothetical protein
LFRHPQFHMYHITEKNSAMPIFVMNLHIGVT